ncbi:MAG: ABC transporter ATP-binding protein [Lachnotalea sp.]
MGMKRNKKKERLSIKKVWSNNVFILKYFVKFVPFYFYSYTGFTILVSLVWVITGSISLKFIFDALESGKSFSQIMTFLVFVSMTTIVRNVVGSYVVEYLEPVANVTMKEKLREELFEKASKMDLEYYETPKFYTDFVWAASQADNKIYEVLWAFMNFTAKTSELLFMGGVMVVLDPALLVFAIAAVILRLIFNSIIVKKKYELDVQAKPIERERDYSQRIFYLKDYAKEIRLSSVHKILYARFNRATNQMQKIYHDGGKKLAGIGILSGISQEFLLSFAMMVYLAYKIIVSKTISLGDFAALIYTTQRFARRMRELVDVMTKFTETSMYIEKFKSFLAYTPKIEEHTGKAVKDEVQEIKLENVSFTYTGETVPSLKNINMTIKPYEKIAIVGYNGAGKSTLIKLLMRLYDVSEGTISMGNVNIKEYDTADYRKNFGAVFQDFQIFAATLAENVAMDFVSEKEKVQVVNALVHSGFNEKLKSLQMGIDTPLTKEFDVEGTNLSGGESQKVAIARVFVKPFKYVTMDEPSSALDPISEYNLNQNMLEIAKDKTVIFISHRLSTTCMADRIFMLEKGEIIEQGTHQELIQLKGKYAEMFLKQAGKYQ